jgi:beta-glucosidase/6-phospho-beta-glucosidase/beta-galactosidase
MTGGPEGTPALKIWGGLECTVNRVGDGYLNQLDRNGHASRPDDLERFATLGIQAIRYPLLWELMAPDGLDAIDWRWSDERMATLRRLGIRPIVGLVHHGSGPRHTDLLDPAFAIGLADYAGAVAARYPWVTDWTPVNEPLTTARFAALYGVWYPHARDDASFVRALLNQVRATVLAMRAIRQVNPNARLVQTEDLGKTYSTKPLVAAADFYNERRWLSWDLLCGRVDSTHALWDYLTGAGADAAELLWFRDNPCPPDVVGVNYYVTGERWIDHRPERYPEAHRGAIGGRMVADIEAARALATPTPGIGALLDEAWSRYRLPIAITEVHIDAHREDQLRWLVEVWRAAEGVRRDGAEVIAVTVWALLGSFDWNGLVCAPRGYYEPGPFDVRSPTPRPTALATLVRSLAAGEVPAHPALHHEGWWRRPGRFFCKPVSNPTVVMPLKHYREALPEGSAAPILISGASGTLGRAFARACAERHLSYRLLTRGEMDIADSASVAAALRAASSVGRDQCKRLCAHRRRRDRARSLPSREHDRADRPGAALRRPRDRVADLLERPGLLRRIDAALGRERPDRAAERLRAQQGRRRSRGARRAPRRDGDPDQRVLRTLGPVQLCRRHPARTRRRRRGASRRRRAHLADLCARPREGLSRSADRRGVGALASGQRRRCQLGRARRPGRRAGRRRRLGAATVCSRGTRPNRATAALRRPR